MGLFSGILSGLGGLVGDIIGAQSNAKAVKKATNAQLGFMQKGLDEQQREYDTTRADFKPYMDFGASGLGPLGDLLGLHGADAASTAINSLKASPIYQSLFNNGQEAILANASATGGVRGGNTQGALADFGRDTLSQVIQDQIQRLFGAAGVGEGTTGSVAQIGAHTADAITGQYNGMGQATAGGILGRQNVYNNLSNQISSLLSSFIPGGG